MKRVSGSPFTNIYTEDVGLFEVKIFFECSVALIIADFQPLVCVYIYIYNILRHNIRNIVNLSIGVITRVDHGKKVGVFIRFGVYWFVVQNIVKFVSP